MAFMSSVNTCVCCGEVIPEGRQVCPKCLDKCDAFNGVQKPKYTGEYVLRNKYTYALLRKKMLTPIVFYSRAEAWEYMRKHKLNPKCFEIVKIK